MKIHVANKTIITRTLQRKKKGGDYSHEVALGEILREILVRANEFVPSESGSILLDDPILKRNAPKNGRLYFIACFGKSSRPLVGTYLSDNVGIVGETYKSGKPCISEDVSKDRNFFSKIDDKTKYETRSIISAPINLLGSIIGVIELINRKDRINYDMKDLSLLEIFASYTSTLIQNALDAGRFEELSKIDDLTGLYNDRFFYKKLKDEIKTARENNKDLALIFIDLDNFKLANDTYGHLAGSRILKEVGKIMRNLFDETGAVTARYGGDEYIILMPETDLKKAGMYAEKLKKQIEYNTFLKYPNSSGEPALNIKSLITCSVGVASLKENVAMSENLAEAEKNLIKAADHAMYKAKENGKNNVILSSSVLPIKTAENL